MKAQVIFCLIVLGLICISEATTKCRSLPVGAKCDNPAQCASNTSYEGKCCKYTGKTLCEADSCKNGLICAQECLKLNLLDSLELDICLLAQSVCLKSSSCDNH